MSWQYRTSFKVFPGLRLNVSSRGLSATIGASPFSVNLGSHGTYANLSIPGTGLRKRVRIDGVASPGAENASPEIPQFARAPFTTPVEEIRSASTEILNSTNLEPVRKLLRDAYEEQVAISQELAIANGEFARTDRRYSFWANGLILKRVFKIAFATRKTQAETAKAKRDELEEQLRLTALATEINVDHEQAEPYVQMRDAFAALSESKMVWDTLDRRQVNRVIERSAATHAINRAPVAFSLCSCDVLSWDQKVPHLPNKNGGDLFLYPGFVLYRASRQAFALVDFRDVFLTYQSDQFIEEGKIPTDAAVLSQVWAKSNKDGSRDRRFTNNYQIPLVRYGRLTLRTNSGLHEEYQISNAQLAEGFAKAWNRFQSSLEESHNANSAIQ
jgi:hypothetical protein